MTVKHSDIAAELPQIKRPAISPLILLLLVHVMILVGGILVVGFVAVEHEREMLTWQNRLNLIADSRAADIEGWLDRHFKELGGVAENPSLQLYLSEILAGKDTQTAPAEEPSQAVFLRNLLSMTADRLGFVDRASQELKSINASVAQPSGRGLALLDAEGKVLVSTLGLPALDPDLARKVGEAPKDKSSLIDIYTTEAGEKRIGFVLPLYPIQGDASNAQPIGRLVGVKAVDGDFFKLLRHPGVTEKTLEAVLLRKEGDNVAYLSPQDNDKTATAALALSTPGLDASHAVTSPGGFAQKKDAQGQRTLMTSRAFERAPWTLMLHIERDQALADSDAWLRQVVFTMGFALLAMIGGIVAVWYYGTSRRNRLLSLETQRLALRYAAQEKLLRVVADNQLEPIVIADHKNIARFANAKAAEGYHLDMPDVAGKDLAALMGAAQAKGYEAANEIALARKKPYVRTWKMENGAHVQVIRSEHIPLEHVPVEGLPMPSPGVLMIDQDITKIVNEREQRMRILRQLVSMLVSMVDRRDPYAASHSSCVAFVARSVASGMGLDAERVETAEMAGNLMNIGKIIVPSEVLTKTESLTEEEKRTIRDSAKSSLALLQNIEFDGPVVETLRQAQERFDGLGSLGMKGEEILITARIIAVANAFVGMVSPRSYRQAIAMDQVLKTLLTQIDTQFDRRVVVALADFVENKQGMESLKKLMPQ